MGRSVPHNLKSTHQTEFVKIFNSLCGRYGRWEIWQDFITLAAIAISNTVDRSQAAEREKTYMTIAGKYKPEEMLKFSQMLQEVVIGMDFNPDQDFLGELYMALDLGNDHAGQFFTPYNVCRMMAEITKRGVRSDCKAITQDGQKQKNNSSKINGVSCQSPRLRSVLTAPLRLSSYGKTDWDLARFCSAATTYP